MNQATQRLNDELHRQQTRALLSFAFFRWESAAMLAVTLLLVVFLPDPFQGLLPFWGRWVWIVLGAFAEVLILVTTLGDPDLQARVGSEMFRARFNPDGIANAGYRQKVEKALAYRDQIVVLTLHTRTRALRRYLDGVVDDLLDWIDGLFDLVRRMDQSYSAADQYRSATQAAILDLEKRQAGETDKQIKALLTQVIADKRKRLQQLEQLEDVVGQADAQLEDALQTMASIYAQMQLIGAQGVDGQRMRQFRQEIAEQTRSWHDLIGAIDQFYPLDKFLMKG